MFANLKLEFAQDLSKSFHGFVQLNTTAPHTPPLHIVILRPEISDAVAIFDNLPVEFQMFVNVNITEVFLAHPG